MGNRSPEREKSIAESLLQEDLQRWRNLLQEYPFHLLKTREAKMNVFKTLIAQSCQSQNAYSELTSHHLLPPYYTKERIRVPAKKKSYTYMYTYTYVDVYIYIHGKTGGRDIILAERFQRQGIRGVAEVPVRALPQHLLVPASSRKTDRLTVSFHKNQR